MNEGRFLTCPNCGANITNTQNCEYCGSLLVRFADRGIDLSKTTYLDNTHTSSKLMNALRLCLMMQEQSSESVVMDIYQNNPFINVGCVLRSGFCAFGDGTIIPSKTNKGLCVLWQFNEEAKEEHMKFKTLDSFPLFIERSCIVGNLGDKEKITEYFIDFGCDAEGAARLLSDVIYKVYGVIESELDCPVNAGNDNIQKSRNYYDNRKPATKSKSMLIFYLFLIFIMLAASVFVLFIAEDEIQFISGIAGIFFFGYYGYVYWRNNKHLF